MKNLLWCSLLISNIAFSQKGIQLGCYEIKEDMGVVGIQPTIFLNSNDSFYSYCFCFGPGRQDGIWNYESDSSITLSTLLIYKDSFIKTLNVIEEKISIEQTELWFVDQNLIPLQLQISTKDTSYSTDSLGRIIFFNNSFMNRRVNIRPEGYSKAYLAYFPMEDTTANKFTIILSEPTNSHEFVYSLSKIENTDYYSLTDKAGNKLVAIFQKCPREGEEEFMLGK